jgi:hypothetical protein
MASKNKSRYYPVQSRIELSSGGIVIAPNVLSMINRRHYPATGVYECNVILNPTVTAGQLNVYVLKDNWDTIGAIRKAYEAYRTATASERAMLSKDQIARWEDFRIAHGTGLVEMGPFVYNAGLGSNTMTLGEFELSTVVDSAGNEKAFVLQGATNSGQYNILTQWSAAGNVQTDPVNLTSGAPYGELEESHDGTQSDNLQRDGNNPPYDAYGNDLIGSPWTKVATLTNANVGADGRISTGFFRAPLGMIIITGADANGWGILQVREGSTKGIKIHNILG